MTTVDVPKHVVSREVDGETIILDVKGGTYYGLSDVGTFAWRLIVAGSPIDAIPVKIAEAYDVAKAVAERDLSALLDDLVAKKLVTVDE